MYLDNRRKYFSGKNKLKLFYQQNYKKSYDWLVNVS